MITSLELPPRQTKPRTNGITMVIDGGLPVRAWRDVVESYGELIDLVKFGWGTSVVTPRFEEKVAVLEEHGVAFELGGTLFEKHVAQDRFDDFIALLRALRCRHVEVSNGTIAMSNLEKASYVRKLSGEFTVLSEVGFKDPERAQLMSPSVWIDAVKEDLDAGASLVVLEARESGRSGICRPDGEVRYGLIEDLLTAGLPADRLLFEAPNTKLQTYFIKRLGPGVNLGNVAPSDVIPLETLRLGLRADTLTCFDRPAGTDPDEA